MFIKKNQLLLFLLLSSFGCAQLVAMEEIEKKDEKKEETKIEEKKETTEAPISGDTKEDKTKIEEKKEEEKKELFKAIIENIEKVAKKLEADDKKTENKETDEAIFKKDSNPESYTGSVVDDKDKEEGKDEETKTDDDDEEEGKDEEANKKLSFLSNDKIKNIIIGFIGGFAVNAFGQNSKLNAFSVLALPFGMATFKLFKTVTPLITTNLKIESKKDNLAKTPVKLSPKISWYQHVKDTLVNDVMITGVGCVAGIFAAKHFVKAVNN